MTKCKVNGCLGKSLCGKYSGICRHISATSDECKAHGNMKCVYKIKVK